MESVTRRSVLAGLSAAAVVGTPGLGGTAAHDYVHPAIPGRVLDRQLDAAVRRAIAAASPAARGGLAVIAARCFGSTGVATVAVPRLVQHAVDAVLRRG